MFYFVLLESWCWSNARNFLQLESSSMQVKGSYAYCSRELDLDWRSWVKRGHHVWQWDNKKNRWRKPLPFSITWANRQKETDVTQKGHFFCLGIQQPFPPCYVDHEHGQNIVEEHFKDNWGCAHKTFKTS